MLLAECRTRMTSSWAHLNILVVVLLPNLMIFPSWKKSHPVGRAEPWRGWVWRWELAIGERHRLEVKDHNKKYVLGWYGRDCRRGRAVWQQHFRIGTRLGRHKSSAIEKHIHTRYTTYIYTYISFCLPLPYHIYFVSVFVFSFFLLPAKGFRFILMFLPSFLPFLFWFVFSVFSFLSR